MIGLATLFDRTYGWIAGAHPHRRMPHFQWISTRDLYRDLRSLLPCLCGRVLDIGCAEKPYGDWLTGAESHFGVDLAPGPKVDAVIPAEGGWPLESAGFDSVLCTQVFQYVRAPREFLSEIHRVLKPGGTLLLTVPFSYNEHSRLGDYWRFSAGGIREFLSEGFEVSEVRKEGRIGTFIAVPFLNWIDAAANRTFATRLLKGAGLPLWALFCVCVNAAALLLNGLDGSGRYYINVAIMARKK